MPNDDFIARPPDMTKIKKFRPTHMNGMCVDVTLTDKEGNEIEMPSPFDIMDERASLNYSGHSETGRRNGEYLKQVMESVGFQAYECEWWHFYDVSTDPAPLDYEIYDQVTGSVAKNLITESVLKGFCEISPRGRFF